MDDKLNKYKSKRDFDVTPEPQGDVSEEHSLPIFVIQKHDASRLHYDLRLEVGGVLKSWAVPKGPSTDPAVKRLAVATEDHPMEYADFEGVIPKGEYGGGAVIVWDTGVYRNLTEKKGVPFTMEKGLEHGHVKVWLEGKKLRGAFSINRFISDGKQEQWLLVKAKDEAAGPKLDFVKKRPESVLTGRTVEEVLAEDAGKDGKSMAAHIADEISDAPVTSMPGAVEPMLATLSKLPGDQSNYGFEFKWDGIRIIAYWNGRTLRLDSRNGLDVTFRWPELKGLGELIGETPVILDGELVAIDQKGKISFSLLAKRMRLAKKPSVTIMRDVPISYMIFDVLHLGAKNLMNLPYASRRAVLDKLNLTGDWWKTPPYHPNAGDELLKVAVDNEIEGIIAKKIDSPYLPGKRSGEWLKIKTINRQELVIGGWIPLKGVRERGVGALLTGYYDSEGKLRFAGKVGTGYKDTDRQELRKLLETLERKSSPFADTLKYTDSIYAKPNLVAEFEYREWTPQGRLRHPSFKGLRDDKSAEEVVMELPGK